jgi:hypothetical protein
MAKVLSFGGGMQTVTLAAMCCNGDFEMPDFAVFADTGWETQSTYDYLKDFIPKCASRGLKIITVKKGNIREDALSPLKRFASMPLWTKNGIQKGALRRQCTNEYKIREVQKTIRREFGIEKGKRWKGDPAEVWIGISTNEAQRMSDSREKWIINRWPLIEKRMNRHDCEKYLEANNQPIPPKSACIGCPFHDNTYWRRLKAESPKDWGDAVEFDVLIRGTVKHRNKKMTGDVFLHPSLKPLGEADLGESQVDLWMNDCKGFCGV